VDALALGADVVFTEGVADEELPAYYSAATCFVLPSLAEGFGLPPLEAMACGCPTIVSAAGALPEVAADAALVVQAGDADSLRAALERVLDDAGLRADLRERGLARAAHYSWDRTAAETVQAYEELLGERGQRRPAHV
jgi:glycosyltransferase involved in cell wall biosynthesis